MRMNRFDWLAGFFHQPLRFRAKKKHAQREAKRPRCWIIDGKRYYAHTRSEARALAKKERGIRGRLPIDADIIEDKKKAG